MTYEFTKTDLENLRATLNACGRGGDAINPWLSDIEEALENRVEGEDLTVELRGLRDIHGNTVHFHPENA